MKNTGFTLLELLVVIAILGFLSTVGVSKFGAFKLKAEEVEAKMMLSEVYLVETNSMLEYDTYASCLTALGIEKLKGSYYKLNFEESVSGALKHVRDKGNPACIGGKVKTTTKGLINSMQHRQDGKTLEDFKKTTVSIQTQYLAEAVRAEHTWSINEKKELNRYTVQTDFKSKNTKECCK